MRNIRGMSLLAVLAVILFAFSGCGDDGNDVRSHLNEHDFAQNPSLVASMDHVVIINLEHPDATDVHKHDSHVIGIDRIPLYFPEDVLHKFTVEHKEEDAYSVVLLDEANNEILRVDRGNTTVTENITAGTYTLEILHGSGIDGAYTLFVRPGSTYIGGDCINCDLTYADLSDVDLSGANLRGANLSNADLSSADLSGAYLGDATLINADLSDAILINTDLSTADLTYADLSSADLSGANLRGAYLRHAYLRGAFLTYADLSNADLRYANLINANLRDTDLRYAFLMDANLSNADLSNADLRNAFLLRANLSGANLSGANLSGATWTEGTKCAEGSVGIYKILRN